MRQSMEWQLIETAPKDPKIWVLTFDPTAPSEERIRIDCWDYIGRDKYGWPVYGWDGSPTHWMPLPDPPN